MAEQTESLALLSRALDQVGALIGGTSADQAELPTPCRSWTVRQLVGHLVRDVGNFATAARGGRPDYSQPLADPGDDWAAAFASARRDLDDAWNGADLETPVQGMGGEAPLVSRADQQVTELAVHGWDLARATGQGEQLDADVAEYGLAWSRKNLGPQFRGSEEEGKSFGEEVAVPSDAPVYERLAGWFGRDPNWSATAG